MRVVVQRVSRASVSIAGRARGAIGQGALILLGVEEADGDEDVEWLAQKIASLRVFDDDDKRNLSLRDVGGDALVVSQFTLYASTKKGARPSYVRAARPETAIPLYERFVDRLSALLGKPVATGEFGAAMSVDLVNDGPVTICMDSRRRE